MVSGSMSGLFIIILFASCSAIGKRTMTSFVLAQFFEIVKYNRCPTTFSPPLPLTYYLQMMQSVSHSVSFLQGAVHKVRHAQGGGGPRRCDSL